MQQEKRFVNCVKPCLYYNFERACRRKFFRLSSKNDDLCFLLINEQFF